MSTPRENVIWQSADGTWSLGVYPYAGRHDYEYDRFEWVSCGHATWEEANQSWTGSNMGGSDGADPSQAAHLDDIAAKAFEQSPPRTNRWDEPEWGPTNGTPKRRTDEAVQAEHDKLITEWVGHRTNGYGNMMSPDVDRLSHDMAERYYKMTPAGQLAFEERDKAHRERCRANLKKAKADFRPSQSYGDKYRNRVEGLNEVGEFLDRADNVAKRRILAAAGSMASKAGTARAKTTPGSTAGSFAPRGRTDPGNVLH